MPYLLDQVLELGLLPDAAVRVGIRSVLARRLRDEAAGGVERVHARWWARRRSWSGGPIAVSTEAANTQHYEVPPGFFSEVLGPRLKYSCCLFPTGRESLGEAEEAMLRLTAERAGLEDGQTILDLGCGWGAFALWASERYPRSRLLAVSNSAPQRQHIVERAAERGLGNLEVVTANVNDFAPATMAGARFGDGFDRVVSVEMMEHVRNHALLFERIAGWLRPGGRLFVHVFAHREYTYPYESADGSDWMSRHFFTGGIMPSVRHLPSFDRHLVVDEEWLVPGTHYARTSELWLHNLGRRAAAAEQALATTHGAEEAKRAMARWRVFFLACAELFAFRGGNEWLVAHYRFAPRNSDTKGVTP